MLEIGAASARLVYFQKQT